MHVTRAKAPFWVIWILGLCPAVAIWSIFFTDHLSQVNWWIVAASYYFMAMGVSMGFHRYFSHSSFQTGRVFQFILGLAGTLSGQTGPLSWSLEHDIHHRNCETEVDPHSTNVSFLHAHILWLWNGQARHSELEKSKWFKYPELVFLEAAAPVIFYAFGVTIWVAFGTSAMVWYWLLPSALSFHATMMINSVGHGHGFFPYKDMYQPDACRATNIPWGWPFILGDNWHCNHHAYPTAAFHGWKWWEIDPNRYVLTVLHWVGVVKRPLSPNQKILERNAASRSTMPPQLSLAAPNFWKEQEEATVAPEAAE